MMGELPPDQNALFYEFCLENYVPQDHLLRKIDPLLDLSALRKSLSRFYSHTGRPSIDPEVMLRMLIVGYCYGIRSERRLCEEVHLNLAYRWFCRLGLEGKVPDHSTFSENRHGRFRDSDVFRQLFESVLMRCMAEDLVGGEGFAVDASLVKADASHQRQREDDDDWGDGRAVREYLEALDEGSAQVGASGRRISPTDPAASYTAAHRAKGVYAYSTNYLVDIRHGIIMDTEATPANLAREVDSTRHMIERVERRFGITPQRLIGDTAYGTAPMLGWLVERKHIAPHVPVRDKTAHEDGTFSGSDFQWDAIHQEYRCPAGKQLRSRQRNFAKLDSLVTKANNIIYRASKSDCESCCLKQQCCPKAIRRKITRSVHEDARDVARRIARTTAYKQSRNERKKVEMLFAHLKRILKLDRLRLRGMSGARDEFLLAATAQNLRRMARLLSRPPPIPGVAVPA
ncbi:MAG: IS1182 family transposase [Gammaproteobacteria bacterium]|jgi:transposase